MSRRLMAFWIVLLVGCSGPDDAGDDGQDWPWCPGDRTLYTPCETHADCCLEQSCVPEGPGAACGFSCVTDDDCRIPLDYYDWPSCSEGVCVLPCEDDGDCPSSMTCGGSICVWEFREEPP